MKNSSPPKRISDLINLGKKSEWYLSAVGINTISKLKKRGSIQTYCDLKTAFPKEVTLVFLWALEGALSNTHWNAIPKEVKAKLQEEVEKIENPAEPLRSGHGGELRIDNNPESQNNEAISQ